MKNKTSQKKIGEELQQFLQFRNRHYSIPPKKGKGSFKRHEKHKQKPLMAL